MPKQQNDTAARPRWNRLWRQRPTPRGSISPNKMNRAAPYLFLAPSLAGLCVFVLVLQWQEGFRRQSYRW